MSFSSCPTEPYTAEVAYLFVFLNRIFNAEFEYYRRMSAESLDYQHVFHSFNDHIFIIPEEACRHQGLIKAFQETYPEIFI